MYGVIILAFFFPVRHYRRDGENPVGYGIFYYAPAGVTDWGMSVRGGEDIYGIPPSPHTEMSLYILSQ